MPRRALNPGIAMLIRSPNADEAARLQTDLEAEFFVPEQVMADQMVRRILALQPGRAP